MRKATRESTTLNLVTPSWQRQCRIPEATLGCVGKSPSDRTFAGSKRDGLHRGAKSSPRSAGPGLGPWLGLVSGKGSAFSSSFPEAAPSLQLILGGEVSFYNLRKGTVHPSNGPAPLEGDWGNDMWPEPLWAGSVSCCLLQAPQVQGKVHMSALACGASAAHRLPRLPGDWHPANELNFRLAVLRTGGTRGKLTRWLGRLADRVAHGTTSWMTSRLCIGRTSSCVIELSGSVIISFLFSVFYIIGCDSDALSSDRLMRWYTGSVTDWRTACLSPLLTDDLGGLTEPTGCGNGWMASCYFVRQSFRAGAIRRDKDQDEC